MTPEMSVMIWELSLLLAVAPQIDQLSGNAPERTRIIWKVPEMSLKAYETDLKFPETGLPVGEALEIILLIEGASELNLPGGLLVGLLLAASACAPIVADVHLHGHQQQQHP